VGLSYGTGFTEPGVGTGIKKAIANFTYTNGDTLGSNFLVIEALQSSRRDPAANGSGAREYYGVFQRNLSMNALNGTASGVGPFKDVNLTARIDLGTKNTRFASRPRKFRPGISASLPVPAGFWEAGIQAYYETNHNGIVNKNVTFMTTWALTTAWDVPAGPGSWVGFLDIIGPKGTDGFGAATKTEALLQVRYMFKVADTGLKVGVGYEYWHNKFGTDAAADPTGGSITHAPVLMAEYHF
jgi:nucleoside-specific outer membrane channel protein Tsx